MLPGLLYMVLKHLVDRYNIYFVYGPSKISSRIHASAISIVIISITLQQLSFTSLSILRRGFNDISIYSLIGFCIALLFLSAQMLLNSCKGFSPFPYEVRLELQWLESSGFHCSFLRLLFSLRVDFIVLWDKRDSRIDNDHPSDPAFIVDNHSIILQMMLHNLHTWYVVIKNQLLNTVGLIPFIQPCASKQFWIIRIAAVRKFVCHCIQMFTTSVFPSWLELSINSKFIKPDQPSKEWVRASVCARCASTPSGPSPWHSQCSKPCGRTFCPATDIWYSGRRPWRCGGNHGFSRQCTLIGSRSYQLTWQNCSVPGLWWLQYWSINWMLCRKQHFFSHICWGIQFLPCKLLHDTHIQVFFSLEKHLLCSWTLSNVVLSSCLESYIIKINWFYCCFLNIFQKIIKINMDIKLILSAKTEKFHS